MELSKNNKIIIISIISVMILFPLLFVAPEVYSSTNHPEGVVEQPSFLTDESPNFILIILDGVGTDVMLDEEMMPMLNNQLDDYAKLSVTTGPLTLSATCVKEMMTGVPNDPVDGLNNFDLKHPGGLDPWILAANDPNREVVMIGSYVMGNMYDSTEGIEFIYTFKGHSDYYEGDDETYDLVMSITENATHDTISAHFSGPDKVGHTWGIDSNQYFEKMLDIDQQIHEIVEALGNDWNIIITADHGMTDSGTHGSAELVTRDVTALVKGPSIDHRTEGVSKQRDLSALTNVLLNQPMPIQLNGRIPIEILAYSEAEKAEIEQWNWEAAKQRYIFFNGNSDQLSESINWELVDKETKFDKTPNKSITYAIWMMAIVGCIYIFKPQMSNGRIFALECITFASFVSLLVYSQDRLDFSAMIPRGIGAACAVYVSSIALSEFIPKEKKSLESRQIFSILISPIIIPYLVVGIYLFTFDISKSILLGTMFWCITYPLYRFQFNQKEDTEYRFSNGFYWMMALACLSFSGLRLWFTLVPMLFFAIKSLVDYLRGRSNLIDNLQTMILSVLLLFSILFVNNRITGYHVMNKILRMGWPNDTLSILIHILALVAAVMVSGLISKSKIKIKTLSIYTVLCLMAYLTLVFESTNFDRMILVILIGGYGVSIKYSLSQKKSIFGKDLLKIIITCHILVIWGVWGAFVVLLLLPCVTILLDRFSLKFPENQSISKTPNWFLAQALTPWMIWILWWTLLGQVNGIQTCAEGICPHPRELDLGRVQVRGGYFGDRINPDLNWMILMISSPIIIISCWLIYLVKDSGMSLKPYIFCQILLVVGSLNILAFSTDSPRLLFSVTWNLVFAILQVMFAIVAVFISKITFGFSSSSDENRLYSYGGRAEI